MFALRNTSVNTNVILLQSNTWANGQVRCSVAELCIDMSGMEEKRIRYTPSLSLNLREQCVVAAERTLHMPVPCTPSQLAFWERRYQLLPSCS